MLFSLVVSSFASGLFRDLSVSDLRLCYTEAGGTGSVRYTPRNTSHSDTCRVTDGFCGWMMIFRSD